MMRNSISASIKCGYVFECIKKLLFRKKHLLLLQTALLTVVLGAQDYNYEWSNGIFDSILPNGVLIADITTPLNSVEESPGSVTLDNNGDILVTGRMKGIYYDLSTFSAEYETEGSTIFIQKTNKEGKLLWAKYIDGGAYNIPPAQRTSNDIVTDNQNNIFICGVINDTTDFDPGPAEVLGIPDSTYTGYIAKYNQNGDFDYVYLLQGGTDAEPKDIAVDKDGNIIVTGLYEYIVDFDAGPGVQSDTSNNAQNDIFLLKINNSGQYLWHKTWGSELPDEPNGLEIDASGNIYISCAFIDSVDADPGAAVKPFLSGSSGITNSYFSKFNSSGDLIWSTLFKSNKECRIYDLTLNGDSIGVIGTYRSPLEVASDGSSHVIPEVSPALGDNAFVIGMDGNGEYLWDYAPQATLTAISSLGLEIASNNAGWFLSLWVSDSVDFDNGVNVDTALSDFTAKYMVKLSKDGAYEWNKKFELDANGFVDLLDIEADTGKVYMLGNYRNAALDANPDPEENDIHPTFYSNTTFLIKFSEEAPMCGTYTIGASAGADFQTINEAISTLRSSAITCDVNFIIEPGTYNETMDLSALNNGIFTVTFTGASLGSTIIHPPGKIPGDSSGISIVNTNNVTLKNFSLVMDDISSTKVNYLSNGTKGINVTNASNIALDGLILYNSNFVANGGTTEYIASAVSLLEVEDVSITNSQISGAGVLTFIHDFNNVHIAESDFIDGQFHIRSAMETGIRCDSITIERNLFEGPFPSDRNASAIYLFGSVTDSIYNVVIQDNLIYAEDANPGDVSHGMFLNLLVEPIIRNNYVENGCDGIFMSGNLAATVESNTIIGASNIALSLENGYGYNVFNNVLASDSLAFSAQLLGNLRYVHNTLYSGGNANGLYGLGITGDSLVIVNNIFSVANTVKNELFLDFVTAANITIDYNLYSGNASENTIYTFGLGAGGGITYSAPTLSDWQSHQNQYDQHSQSFTPSFVGVDDYHISSDTDYRFATYLPDISRDIDNDLRDESIGVDVGADQYCIRYFEAVNVEACAPYLFNNMQLTESGKYFGNFISQMGCDSIVTLNLTIMEQTSRVDVITACENYTWIDGINYTESNNSAVHTLTNAEMCDTVVTLNLTIQEPTSGTDVIAACESHTWIDGITYTESNNTATHTLTNAEGCDSVITLNLMISNADTCSTNSLSDIVGEEFLLYPNPAKNGNFVIEFNTIQNNLTIRLRSISGQVIETLQVQDSNLFKMSFNHPKGLYLLEIENNEGHKSMLKLMIE